MALRAFFPLLVAVVAAGCGGGSATDSTAGTPDLPGDGASRGATVTMTSGCLSCHALGSVGNADIAGRLDRAGAAKTRAQIEKLLVDPPERMPSYEDQLSAADRAAVAEYLASLR